MKKLLLIFGISFYCLIASAQDNPYKVFGYQSKVKYKTNQKDVYRVKNSNTISKIKFFEIDRENHLIRLLDAKNSLIQSIALTNDKLLRWMSVDPLSDKYPGSSPYNYVNNNPMNIVDPDGKDGVKIIDKENKTITIRANYYVESQKYEGTNTILYTSKQIQGLSSIGMDLNKSGFKVTEGDYAGYSIKFDLQFKAGGSAGDLDALASADKFEGIPIGNTFRQGSASQYPRFFKTTENDNGTTSTVGGVTSGSKDIVMNTSTDTKLTRTHEVFHTLFFNQDNAKKGIGSYPPQKPNQNDINTLINNNQLPGFIKTP